MRELRRIGIVVGVLQAAVVLTWIVIHACLRVEYSPDRKDVLPLFVGCIFVLASFLLERQLPKEEKGQA